MDWEGVDLWKKIVSGSIAVGLAALVTMGIIAFIPPKPEPAEITPDQRAMSEAETRQSALETYMNIQATATTTPPASIVNQAIKASSPSNGPTDEERQAVLETYLKSQNP